MKIKRILSIIIILTLVIISGCTNKTSDLSSLLNESSSKNTLILWYYWDDENSQKQISELVKNFNKSQTEIQVKLEYIPLIEYRKRLSLGIVTGDLPDLAMIKSSSQQYYSQKGLFFDITEYLENNIALELYDNQALETCKFRNNIYGLPFGMTVQAMIYNKDILDNAGCGIPENWEDLNQCLRAVTEDNNITGIGFSGLEDEYTVLKFLPFLWSADGDVSSFNDDNGLRAVTYFSNIFLEGFADIASINYTDSDMISKFANGETAIIFTSSDKITSLSNTKINFEWDIAPIPYDKTSTSVYGGDNIAVINNNNSKIALEFLNYISKDTTMEKYANSLGMLSPRTDILEKQYQKNSIINKYKDIAVTARRIPIINNWEDISESIKNNLVSCIIGQQTPEEAVNALQAIIKDI